MSFRRGKLLTESKVLVPKTPKYISKLDKSYFDRFSKIH